MRERVASAYKKEACERERYYPLTDAGTSWISRADETRSIVEQPPLPSLHLLGRVCSH